MAVPKTLRYITVSILTVAVVGFVFIEFACRERMDKRSAFSYDKETAIKEGFYIDTYLPAQSSLVVPNSKDTLQFDSVWSEYSWTTERRFGLCLCEHKVKDDSYNFCMPFSTTMSDINSYPFELKQLDSGADPYYDPGELLR